jgi:hypothetical protein
MKKTRSFWIYLLMILILFQSIGALLSAPWLFLNPSGKAMGLSPSFLDHSPFNNFLIPGLFLFIVLGIMPAVVFAGLIKQFSFPLFEWLNVYKTHHWSWAFAYYTGILLVMWINMQLMMIREWDFLQFIYSVLGVVIIVVTQLPMVKDYYKIEVRKQV